MRTAVNPVIMQHPHQHQSSTIPMPTIYLGEGNHRKAPKPSIVELVLYNMSAMLASVGSGYDVRASNVSPIHPKLQMQMFSNSSDNGSSTDCANVMVQTSYLDGSEFYGNERTGYAHNTYHGPTKHVRWELVLYIQRTRRLTTIVCTFYFRSNLSSMATMADDRSLKFTDSYLTSTISTTSGLGSNYTTNTSGSGSTQPPTPSPRRKTSSTSFKDLVELPETEPNDARTRSYISSRDYNVQQNQQYGLRQQSTQPSQLYANDDNLARHRNLGYFGKKMICTWALVC